MTAAGNRPKSVHEKPKPLAVTKHSRYTLRAEDSFYIHGQKNTLALMTLRKAVVLNVSFLQPLSFFVMWQQKKRIAIVSRDQKYNIVRT